LNFSKPARRSLNPRPDTTDSDLSRILKEARPLLDVRAPVEADRGILFNSTNLPILSNVERAKVGTAYRQHGHDAAEALGFRLVSGDTRIERVRAWADYAREHPGARLMCWRGGQRSAIAQAWLEEAGFSLPRVEGGYKALRRLSLEILQHAATAPKPWWIVAGRTGVGKTVLIRRLPHTIDLEGLANHRGSAFGAHANGQPAPATFENLLASAISRHPLPRLILEDESRTIGRLALPEAWFDRMQQSPLVLIEASIETRIAHIEEEYVHAPLAAGVDPARLQARYQNAMQRISKRLGGARHQRLTALMASAFDHPDRDHGGWIGGLLREYYDPMYDYQLKYKRARIRFTGNLEEVEAFLADRTTA
jgi:tRNA 2-selenouridine synthase